MTDQQLVQQHLAQDLWESAATFLIPDHYLKEKPGIIDMILRSRSVDTKEEKQNRFNLLPLMNEDQVNKLEAILLKEKTKLQEIEQKYEQKKTEIKQKYLSQRQEAGYNKQIEGIKTQEASAQQKDESDAEDLLKSI